MAIRTWTPPTPTPEAGQGPWCNEELSRWWVVCDHPDEAIAAVRGLADVFPLYDGWWVSARRVGICWVDPEDWNEENEIVRCLSDAEGAAEAYEIEVHDV